MKVLVKNYTFSASSKTITFNEYSSIALEDVLMVTNVVDNVIIYIFSDPLLGGSVSGNVLTLDYNTAIMSNTDALQVWLDVPNNHSTEVTQSEIRDLTDSVNTLVQFLYANAPRRDVANRMTVNNSEVTQPVSGTVTATVANATVTTVTALNNILTVSGQPQQFLGQGVPNHLYDNIKVT
jgi:hypothetical protein